MLKVQQYPFISIRPYNNITKIFNIFFFLCIKNQQNHNELCISVINTHQYEETKICKYLTRTMLIKILLILRKWKLRNHNFQ